MNHYTLLFIRGCREMTAGPQYMPWRIWICRHILWGSRIGKRGCREMTAGPQYMPWRIWICRHILWVSRITRQPQDARKSNRCIARFAVGELQNCAMVTIQPAPDCNHCV